MEHFARRPMLMPGVEYQNEHTTLNIHARVIERISKISRCITKYFNMCGRQV
jgi:hemerythrin